MSSLPYKIIYSKRFTHPDPVELLHSAHEETANGDHKNISASTTNSYVSEAGAHLTDNQAYDHVAANERIIRSAIRLSDNYEIDTDILCYPDAVVIKSWLPFSLYEGRIKQLISDIIAEARILSIQADENDPYRFILSLEFSM